jgi:hypothetical protein
VLIVVRGQSVFWPKLPDDLTQYTQDLGVLAHELTHVWQYQNGMTWWKYLLRERGHYKYTVLPNKPFLKYGYEQQAAIVEDYVRLKGGLKPRWGQNLNDIKDIEALVPFLTA